MLQSPHNGASHWVEAPRPEPQDGGGTVDAWSGPVDDDRVSVADRAELVATAARDIDSIHRGAPATVEIAGNGYQVQLPGCRAAGFHGGDRAPAVAR